MIEKIEKITISDKTIASEVLKLQILAYNVEAKLINYYDLPPLNETITDLMASKELFLAYKIDNKIYGILSFEVLKDTIDICKLFVNPKYLNIGIGSKLLKTLETEYSDIKRFIVQTGLKNTFAINFYKKHEFSLLEVVKINKDLEIVKFEKVILY